MVVCLVQFISYLLPKYVKINSQMIFFLAYCGALVPMAHVYSHGRSIYKLHFLVSLMSSSYFDDASTIFVHLLSRKCFPHKLIPNKLFTKNLKEIEPQK